MGKFKMKGWSAFTKQTEEYIPQSQRHLVNNIEEKKSDSELLALQNALKEKSKTSVEKVPTKEVTKKTTPDPKKYIPGHEYNEKGELVWTGSGKDPNTIDYKPTSYDKQEDRPLYQRDYMQDPNFSSAAEDLPGSRYQSASSVYSYGSKKGRDHSKHDTYSGVKDKAAGYDEYSLGAKGVGDANAPEWVKKRNKELRKEAVYNTREANAIGRYKMLEKHYGKGSVPEGRIPKILKDRNPEWIEKRQQQGMTPKERKKSLRTRKKQTAVTDRKEARAERKRARRERREIRRAERS